MLGRGDPHDLAVIADLDHAVIDLDRDALAIMRDAKPGADHAHACIACEHDERWARATRLDGEPRRTALDEHGRRAGARAITIAVCGSSAMCASPNEPIDGDASDTTRVGPSAVSDRAGVRTTNAITAIAAAASGARSTSGAARGVRAARASARRGVTTRRARPATTRGIGQTVPPAAEPFDADVGHDITS